MIDETLLIEKLKKRAKGHEEDAEKSKYENFSCDIDELLLRLADEVDAIIEVINEQPKVGEWIPCSERLPKIADVYNVTRKISEDKYNFYISDSAYFDGQNTWHSDNRVNHGRKYLKDVVAWMPLPEPYKE